MRKSLDLPFRLVPVLVLKHSRTLSPGERVLGLFPPRLLGVNALLQNINAFVPNIKASLQNIEAFLKIIKAFCHIAHDGTLHLAHQLEICVFSKNSTLTAKTQSNPFVSPPET